MYYRLLFQTRSVKRGGDKTSELPCNKPISNVHFIVGPWCAIQCMNAAALCVSCMILSFMLPVLLLHDSLHSKSLVLPPPNLTDSSFDPLWKSPVPMLLYSDIVFGTFLTIQKTCLITSISSLFSSVSARGSTWSISSDNAVLVPEPRLK